MKSIAVARSHAMRILSTAILLGAICWISADKPVYAARAASAQRSVQGRVVDAQEKPLMSAIVYLSDTRTMTVESYITQQDGAYRFEQLSPNDDYKLWAQLGGKKSKVRTLSSFDNRDIFRVIIHIDADK